MQDDYVLPLVDITPLNSPHLEDRLKVAEQLDRACREVGFLYLRGEQFKPELFEQMLRVTKDYFAQDDDIKMQNYIGKSCNHSGYVPIGEEQFVGNSYDLKEAYDVNYDYQGECSDYPLLGPTQWPDFPDFKSQVSAYYRHLKHIGDQLFSGFALALGLDENYFAPYLNLSLIHI